MRLRKWGSVVLFVSLVWPASGQNQAKSSDVDVKLFVTSSGSGRGDTTEYWASAEALKRSPQWRPDAEDPPLSIREAVRIARDAVKKRHPKYDDVVFGGLHIMPASTNYPGAENRWVYWVFFHPVVDGQKMWGGDAGAIVLFDGTLAEVRSLKKSR